jgi:hypothetical protein
LKASNTTQTRSWIMPIKFVGRQTSGYILQRPCDPAHKRH